MKFLKIAFLFFFLCSFYHVFGGGTGPYSPANDVIVEVDPCSGIITYQFLFLNEDNVDESFQTDNDYDFEVSIDGVWAVRGEKTSEGDCNGYDWIDEDEDYCITKNNSNVTNIYHTEKDNADVFLVVTYRVPESKLGEDIEFKLEGYWKSDNDDEDFTGSNAIVKTFGIDNPASPSGFSATTDECNQISLNWTNPDISCRDDYFIGYDYDNAHEEAEGCEGEYYNVWMKTFLCPIYGSCCYTIQLSRDGGTWTDIGKVSSYTDHSVADGVEYDYRIRTKYTTVYDRSSYSNPVSVSGNSVAKLPPPSGIDATGTCDGTVELTWVWSSVAPAGFNVYRSNSASGSYTLINDDLIPGDKRKFTDTSVAGGEQYFYKMRTKNECNEFGSLSGSPEEVTIPKEPTPPSGIAAPGLSNGIKITWQDNSNDETGFIILRTAFEGGVEKTFEVDANVEEFNDTTAANCQMYYYEVLAKNDCAPDGVSGGVIETKFVPELTHLVENTVLKASKGYFSNRVELSWVNEDDKEGIIDFYEIYRKRLDSDDIPSFIGSLDGATGLYSDVNADAGVIYEYMVVGIVDCAGEQFSTDTLRDYGFRTPTGDIYGRVTFENGQAEKNVEIRMESEEGISGQSLLFDTGNHASVSDTSFFETRTDSFSVQAWVSPDDLTGTRKIFSKPGMAELGIEENHFYFSAGSQALYASSTVDGLLGSSDFIHITGVYSGDSLYIYINGNATDSTLCTATVTGNSRTATIGENFSGVIDEVRVWSRALPANEIARDYNRYITGGEQGLIAYWTFNYATNGHFYDRSYKNSNYNEHHGLLNGAATSETRFPTNEQLGYKGVTGEDGSYSIRAVPYFGNGTAYTIIPRLGIHQFEPEEAVRFIGEGSESFTVNFIDKSSFKVTGTVTYEGGTIPVEGVSFTIDGVVAVGSNGSVLRTDSRGEFEITVPVGIHEVVAQKPHHVFKNGGRITDSNLMNLNYQDNVLGLELIDITKIKFIGRVAGGAVQDAYLLGHSLSTNNLADGVSVTLSNKNPAYELASKDTTVAFDHLIPSNKGGGGWPKTNEVAYGAQEITIYPNEETGEFIAEVIPEPFTVRVNAPGHDDIPGSGEDLDLSQQLALRSKIHEYTDSIEVDGTYEKTHYSDTVFFHASRKFIKRYSPTVRISQLDQRQEVLPYYGDTVFTITTLGGDQVAVDLYPGGQYLFGMPVFKQNDVYHLKAEVFEEYVYYDSNGNPKEGTSPDEVATRDAMIEFNNNLSVSGISEVEADSTGVAFYQFKVTEPELTSAQRGISAKVYYGSEDNRTSINWEGAFSGIILGAVETGRDFVTGGPDKVLMVLRDPPGSNSYSYLEKGISITESSTYQGNVKNTGSELFTQDLGAELITWTGVGAGTIQTVETKTGFTLGVLHEETVGWKNTSETTTTTTTRFQTSAEPRYVGADADVFIGYSTNIAYGSTENVSIIPREKYFENPEKYEVYEEITPLISNYFLVQQTGLGLSQTFKTLFAYPQQHIVERLLPEMESLRNNFLMQEGEADMDTLQAIANDQDTVFYVSHLPPDDPDFGKSNDDEAFEGVPDPDPDDAFNGPSYRVIFPERPGYTRSDTILYLNQSIENWYIQLKKNEEAKINANLMQNYSFQGGSSVSYSESLSAKNSSTTSFDIMVGLNFKNETGVKILGNGFKLSIDESITTSHGGVFEDAETESHSKGFELVESGYDYISVDVMREDAELVIDTLNSEENFYPTFIFRTQAGATSCPYEGANMTEYYEPGQHIIDQATKQIEVPEIAVEKDFIENIPSGGTAFFTLYLRNNAEIKQDSWFTLKMVEASNPNGAKMFIDGAPIGNGRDFLVPAGETLTKTLEVTKGSVMNYDNLQLALQSQCQRTIADTVTFTVHYTPSCCDLLIDEPGDQWTYNTKLPTVSIDGVDKHYMDVTIGGFDVNYDNFNHIKLQYKAAAESDYGWITLMKFYSDSALYLDALDKGNAAFIDPGDAGTIKYVLKMDDLPDQRYDLRAVSVCMINNEAVENISETVSGIKDMLRPRLFGSPQPANGILTVEDEIRLNFNETIAQGLLTKNNFEVTGIRNGALTDHSVSIRFDGVNDYMETEFVKNMTHKDLTVEMWIKPDEPRDATLFSHGNINESLGLALTSDNHLQLIAGDQVITSNDPVPYEPGSWAHVAFVFEKEGKISGYYNFEEFISSSEPGIYRGIGNFVLGKDISSDTHFFRGYMHNVRIWTKVRTPGQLQVKSLDQLSGTEPGLMAYYPMDRAKGAIAEDKSMGANMLMSGCTWSVPEGRGVQFNGSDSYLKIHTGSSAVIKRSMDYTIEFWFRGAPGQTNATLLSNGRGDGEDLGGSDDLFTVEFDASGQLCFKNNGFVSTLGGDYLDNNWHHFALNVGRTIGRGQIYIDGVLVNYFSAEALGGIAAAYMYLGARGWYAEGAAGEQIIDNHFEGSVDELRIWNLYKYEQQIQNNNNVKLDGSEMGLLAYYPFEYYKEWQGQQELDFSLADMKIQQDPAMAVPDAENNNALPVPDTPPVKDKGPVSDLEFDFVVNDDALIIYLEESPEKIEKTIVTFTVDGVQDVNGNENSSPITWSAFIDRNMLKWSEQEVTVAKELNSAAQFTVQVINKGGAVRKFFIENYPSWMRITPSAGTLEPNSYIDVSFEIDEGLNVGTYNEMIYMVNEDNVPEVLEVTVNARGEKPDWNVDPGEYKYDMSVYGKLRINNIFSKDERDKIAAFVHGKCIGVANVMYEERNDMWYAFLTVYANETSQEEIIFKIWDASTGIIYLADAGRTISFENNGTVGTPANPQIFDANSMIFQNIDLSPGWNWISFNVESPALSSLNELLVDMTWDSSNFFKSEADNLSANYSGEQEQWIEERPIPLGNRLMYKISSSEEQTISLAGSLIQPSGEELFIKGNQWNYISYLPPVRMKLDEALAGYDAREEDIVKGQNRFAMYSGNIGWVGSLSYMEPDEGYMLFRNAPEDVVMKYPDSYGTMSVKSDRKKLPENFVSRAYASNMNLVAVTDVETRPGDRILAFSGEALNSETKVRYINEGPRYFITVTGDAGRPVSFALERNGEIIARSAETLGFNANSVSGTTADPAVLHFARPADETRIAAYPNPAKGSVYISLITDLSGPVDIQIMDVAGRTLIHRKGTSVVNGRSLSKIDCSTWKPGIYFARLTVEETTHMIKIEKQ